MEIQMTVQKFDLERVLEQTLFDAKGAALNTIKHEFRAAQNRGDFPKDENDYNMVLKSYGRGAQRRKIDSIRPNYFRVGTKRSPTTFTFTAVTNAKDVAKAARYGMLMARKRAPTDKGNYKKSLTVRVKHINDQGMNSWREVSYTALKNLEIDKDTIIQIVPEVVRVSKAYANGFPYGLTIEEGYYSNFYRRRLQNGILLYVAKKLQAKFGNRVAIRFRYIAYGGRGVFPGIEFAAPGTFVSRNKRPGSKRRKAARKEARARGR